MLFYDEPAFLQHSDTPSKKNGTRLMNPLVEWFFYPEYVDLKGLAEDHHRVHKEGKESTLMEQPCRFPVTNQGELCQKRSFKK